MDVNSIIIAVLATLVAVYLVWVVLSIHRTTAAIKEGFGKADREDAVRHILYRVQADGDKVRSELDRARRQIDRQEFDRRTLAWREKFDRRRSSRRTLRRTAHEVRPTRRLTGV